jgi:hypothetical protein
MTMKRGQSLRRRPAPLETSISTLSIAHRAGRVKAVCMAKTHREPKHARLYDWETACPAYRSLNVYARALLIEYKRKYNGHNNGGISMSFREACVLVGCSNTPMRLAHVQLIDRGFIKITKPGKFGDRIFAGGPLRASTWTLTEYAIDEPVRIAAVPTKDFMRWQPPADRVAHDQALLKQNRYVDSVRAVRPKRTSPAETVRPEHTGSASTAYVEAIPAGEDSTLRAHTYSLPDIGAFSGGDTPSAMPTKGQARDGGPAPTLEQIGPQTEVLLRSLGKNRRRGSQILAGQT